MGFLDRRVEAQSAKAIAPYARDEEEVLITELVESETFGRMLLDRRASAVATTHGIYFHRRGQVFFRADYDTLAYAASINRDVNTIFGDRLELTTHDGEKVQFSFPMRDGGLGRTVQERLLRLPRSEFARQIGGRQFTLTYNPWRLDIMSYWDFNSSDANDVLTGDLAVEIQQFRVEAGEALMANAGQGSVSIPRWKTADDWLTRDWTVPLTALLGCRNLGPVDAWAPGHQVPESGEGTPKIIAIDTNHLYLALFDSMRPLFFVDRAPDVTVLAFERIADWELRSQSDGRALLRLLVLNEDSMNMESLRTVLETRVGFEIFLVGLADPGTAGVMADAIVERVKLLGAYSPGAREYHPLQSSG
jgi:hypothetical protein